MSWEFVAEIPTSVLVKFKKEFIHHVEECHGLHDFSGWIREIKEVRLFIGDESINITRLINDNMEMEICLRLKEMEENDEI